MANYDDPKKPNLKVLVPIAVGGIPMLTGRVFPKNLIGTKGDWQELLVMTPPRLEQTNERTNDYLYDSETGKLLPADAVEKSGRAPKLPA